MTGDGEFSARSSISVAPLHIVKHKRNSSGASRRVRPQSRAHSRNHSRNHSNSQGTRPQSSQQQQKQQQFTPPPTPTPQSPQDPLAQPTHAHAQRPAQGPPPPSSLNSSAILVNTFLRAFFPFHPTLNPSSNTVTLPLNIGDLILVHSVHTNGWADGTMLSSGARGWLPTNYCEGYDLEQIRPLLRACLSLFDQCKGGGNHQGGNQGVVTGVVAGESTDCLTRESPNVQAHDRIRKHRKVLLSDLSSLVKAAKRIPDHASYNAQDFITAEDIIDEMVLRTFKIVVRGVGFLDGWYDELHNNLEEEILQFEDDCIPPTPPSESASGSVVSLDVPAERSTNRLQVSVRGYQSSPFSSFEQVNTALLPSSNSQTRASSPYPGYDKSINNTSYLTVEGQSPVQSSVTALAQLNITHDILLSYLASYIGRLQLQSRTPMEIHRNTKQSASAAQDLLAVVEAVHARDPGSVALQVAKKAMYSRVASLMDATREVIASHPENAHDNEGVIVHDEGKKLMMTATGCVRGAGECVAKAKFVIERIGDFELDVETWEMGYEVCKSSSASIKEIEPEEEKVEQEQPCEEVEKPVEINDRDLMPPPPPPAKDKLVTIKENSAEKDKPLPLLPLETNFAKFGPEVLPPLPESPESQVSHSRKVSHSRQPSFKSVKSVKSAKSSKSVIRSSETLTHVISVDESAAVLAIRARDAEAKTAFERSFRSDSVGASSAATQSTYMSNMRDSEISQTSTRATSPGPSRRGSNSTEARPSRASSYTASVDTRPSRANSFTASVVDGGSEPEEVDEVTTSFSHELTFNKEGCISGGSLPALVERLTVHDSTPDAVFVATFYLTFRLFTTPKEFSESLIARFDSVACNPKTGTPVRLRVYNVFKGWLESHWRKDCDSVALDTINGFATGKLRAVLPAAGKRLEELATKVSSIDGPLVPRLVSSMGKTNTATAQYTLPDAPVPQPVITRSQLNLLRTAASGSGTQPSFLDFDPLELARQFTLKESRMFCSILPEELIAQEWTKKNGSLAVNVRAMSALSTDLAHLVAETILAQEDSKRRAVVIKQWIKIADRCLELNNYDSLMAIMCTMNASTIVRLKKTWEIVSSRTKQVLEHLRSVIDVSKNHAVLRARLRGHVPPCLPFLGTYLTDLTFVDVGNPSKRPLTSEDGTTTKQLINFDKHIKTARIISELQRFQIPYRIAEVPELQQWIDAQVMRIRTSKAGDVQTLYRRSLLLEPREVPAPITPAIEIPAVTPSIKEKFDFLSWANITSKASAATSPNSSSTSLRE
ncbi:ras guanine nucleotide exchange factor domain-containing protein [Peziza echinospora]|nr:ras guanine nucleotide exchange factor domain-containing protein [Peziza echinospora]